MTHPASSARPRVLFLCTGNSARSQMAEGLLRSLAGDRYEVFSAGTKPVGLNPLAVEAMRELSIDISRQQSKHVSECFGRDMDTVVTVCDHAKETCPIFPGMPQQLHWSFRDPAAVQGSHEEKLGAFREVRDQIRARIEAELVRG